MFGLGAAAELPFPEAGSFSAAVWKGYTSPTSSLPLASPCCLLLVSPSSSLVPAAVCLPSGLRVGFHCPFGLTL